jgi:hypothetical protein
VKAEQPRGAAQCKSVQSYTSEKQSAVETGWKGQLANINWAVLTSLVL